MDVTGRRGAQADGLPCDGGRGLYCVRASVRTQLLGRVFLVPRPIAAVVVNEVIEVVHVLIALWGLRLRHTSMVLLRIATLHFELGVRINPVCVCVRACVHGALRGYLVPSADRR